MTLNLLPFTAVDANALMNVKLFLVRKLCTWIQQIGGSTEMPDHVCTGILSPPPPTAGKPPNDQVIEVIVFKPKSKQNT